MEIYGYKCFNGNGKNRYGISIKEGEIYSTQNEVRYGVDGHGYHFCEHLEDTFRFFIPDNGLLCDDICICKVRGFGVIREREDDRVVEIDDGYYGLYAAEHLEIIKILSREEIINYGLNLYPERAARFLSGLKLTNEEIELFRKKFKNNDIVNDTISYYQLGDTEVYNRKYGIKH